MVDHVLAYIRITCSVSIEKFRTCYEGTHLSSVLFFRFQNPFGFEVFTSHHIGFSGSRGTVTPGALRHWPFRANAHSEVSQQQTDGNQMTVLSLRAVKVLDPLVWSPTCFSVISLFSSSSRTDPFTSTMVHSSGNGQWTLVPAPFVSANPGMTSTVSYNCQRYCALSLYKLATYCVLHDFGYLLDTLTSRQLFVEYW